jgi:hypothetical protein
MKTTTEPKQRRKSEAHEQLLIGRAWSVYLRQARRDGERITRYSRTNSFVRVRGEHIVLRNDRDTLAVFRLVHGSLRRQDPGKDARQRLMGTAAGG